MGRPKAELSLGEETMLCRQIRRLRRVCGRASVVGIPLARHGWPVPDDLVPIPDLLPGHGPLGGILTGLAVSRTEWNLFLGCDLPFVSARLLQYLGEQALVGDADAVIPKSRDGRLQPLCAVYRRSARYAARSRLERGENRMSRFFQALRFHPIPWPEIAKAGFPPWVFDNMNTPQDYEDAKRRLNFSGHSSFFTGP